MPSKVTKSVRRRGREVGQGQGELWEKAKELECSCWKVASSLIYMYNGSTPSVPGPRNKKPSVLSPDSAS